MIGFKIFRKLLSTSITANLLKPQYASFASGEHAYEKCINQVTLLGRVGTEPTVRGSDQNPLISFSMATHIAYKNTDEIKQKTDWHKVVVFKPNLRDRLANYLKKGQRIFVQGKITHGQYQDANGNPQYSTSIIAEDVIFMGSNETKDKEE